MTDKAILQGDLSAVQLPDILSFVSMIRRTGRLVLRHDSLERCIYWNEGEIVFATSNSPEHTLGQFLLRNGKITEEQWRMSISKVTPETRHGKLLVQMGAISPKELWWGVKNQVLEIIYSVFSWNGGDFSFFETGAEIQERITLSVNTSSIIMEGIRRIDEGALIRERITGLDMVFTKVHGSEEQLHSLDLSPQEAKVYERIDGRKSVRELIGLSELTEFEVMRILYQLLSARIVEVAPAEKKLRPVFLDVEDSPELLKVISSYNDMFGYLYGSLERSVGDEQARDIFIGALQTSDSDELWTGVFFDQYGRFDENMLLANVSELPFEERKAVLDEGLNTLLSIQLFEVSQHLDPSSKVEVFRFISDQKQQLAASGIEN